MKEVDAIKVQRSRIEEKLQAKTDTATISEYRLSDHPHLLLMAKNASKGNVLKSKIDCPNFHMRIIFPMLPAWFVFKKKNLDQLSPNPPNVAKLIIRSLVTIKASSGLFAQIGDI